jgi:hypothetical protein
MGTSGIAIVYVSGAGQAEGLVRDITLEFLVEVGAVYAFSHDAVCSTRHIHIAYILHMYKCM